MRILIVEDDIKIASFIEKGLREAGFAVDRAAEGEDGLHLGLTEPYDAAVIDIMLPKLDGLTLIQELRRQGNQTPVIVLSAKQSVDDRIKGLQVGGDDYLVKPFAFSELLARLQALIRRATCAPSSTRLTYKDMSLDLVRREAVRAGRRIDLQPRELMLLEYLLRNPEKVLSKTMIMEHIYGYHFDPQTNVVDVLVCRLRNKIDKDFDERLIQTIRGVGYVLRPLA